MEKKIIVLSLEDYNDSCNDEQRYYENTSRGFAQALKDLYKLADDYGEEYSSELSWREDIEPKYSDTEKTGVWYSNDDWLYFGIYRSTIWTSQSLEVE